MNKKFLFFIGSFVFFSIQFIFSAPVSLVPVNLLSKAELELQNKNFSQALSYAEEAKRMNTEIIKSYISELTFTKESYVTRKSGDDIKLFYQTLEEIHEIERISILDTIFLNYPISFFNNSLANLFSWLETRIIFPEADILIAQILIIEGEYNLALQYLENAWNHKDLLDIPDSKYEIAYTMAEISRALGNVSDEEKYLLLIVKDDPFYGPAGKEPATLLAMKNTIKNEKSVEKFFNLYRNSNYKVMKAYNELSLLYVQEEEIEKAFSASILASIIAITRLTNAIQNKDFTYTYFSLPDAFTKLSQHSMLYEMSNNESIWDIFFQFSLVLEKKLYLNQTISLLKILEIYSPNPLISAKAQLKLQKLQL